MSEQTQTPGSAASSGSDGSAQRPAPRYPSSITKAVWVMIAQMVLSWLGIALAMIATDGDAPRADGLTSFDQAVGEVSVWVIILAIFFTALYAMLAQQVLAGAHWARVTVWFLAGANAFFGIVGLITVAHLGWNDALGVLGVALDVALIVLLAARPNPPHSGRTP